MQRFSASLAAAALLAAIHLAAPIPMYAASGPAAPTSSPARKSAHRTTRLTIAREITTLLADPTVSRAHWGISVTTLDGKPIYSLNDGQFFQPASNTKLVTTTTALALLGPDLTTKTLLTESGTRTPDGVLHGALRLIGAADSGLNNLTWPYTAPAPGQSDRFDTLPEAFNQLAHAAAQSGLTAVDGPLIADDSYFPYEPYGPGWSWDDLPYYYAVPIDAFNANDNVVYLTLTPGEKSGDPVQASWALTPPHYQLDVKSLSTSAANISPQIVIDHFTGTTPLRVFGTTPAGKIQHIPVAVDDPATFAADLLRSALIANGIKVSGATQVVHQEYDVSRGFERLTLQPLTLHSQAAALAALEPTIAANERVIATHTGPPLWQDIQYTDKVSQNQHAEILMHLLGRAYGADGSGAEGVRVERQFLTTAGIDMDDVILYDGSGMSNNDMLTPRSLTQLLRYAATQPWFPRFHDALGIGGIDGTLGSRFTKPPLKGKVIAKTGTLSEAHALSGYLTCASGRTIVFSILADMHSPITTADRQTIDKIVAVLYAAN